MRKIIITIIATFFIIAPLEKAKGQTQTMTSADFPTVQVLIGTNAKLSFGLERFDLFLEIGQFLLLFQERATIRTTRMWEGGETTFGEYYTPSFFNMWAFRPALGFSITERDIVRVTATSTANQFVDIFNYEWDFRVFLEYIRRQNLSQRTRINLSAGIIYAFWASCFYFRTHSYLGARTRAKLDYKLTPNLKLNVQLGYTRTVNVGQSFWRHRSMESLETFLTRNIFDFSVGIHYHIPLGGQQQQQAQQRPPRQRVAPHQRALPCPPGQMRHQRSWDRPSPIFNHPSGR